MAIPITSGLTNLRTYAPILWILTVVTFVSLLICGRYETTFMQAMTHWMAGLLVIFSLLKLFNISGFAEDFQKYDLIAMRSPTYAKAYPFIELGLGGALILGFAPVAVNFIILIVFGIGFLGVWQSIRRGENLQCACVGRMFNLPLSRVALVEDGVMVLMAIIMIWLSFS